MNGDVGKKKSIIRIEFLDYIRGIAILSVYFFHSLSQSFHFSSLPWNGLLRSYAVPKSFLILLPASFGWAGVSIFFVVSGFCIHLSFNQHNRQWGSFFIRRFFRIYPPYFFALLLFAIIFSMPKFRLEQDLFSGSVDWRSFFIHLFLIHNFDLHSFWIINPAFWSIAVEAQLYLIYPLLLLMVSRLGWKRAIICVAICELLIDGISGISEGVIGSADFFGFKPPTFLSTIASLNYHVAISPLGYWFSWSLGAYIADAFIRDQPLPFAKSSILFWSVLIGISYFVRPLYSFFFVLVALLTATSISKLISGEFPKVRIPYFCLKFLRQTGLWSYSIYLLHQPLIVIFLLNLTLFFPVTQNYPLLRFFFCIVSWFAIMLLGRFWHQVFELPSIALGKQFVKRNQQISRNVIETEKHLSP
jgi:peptidoglycan/LPS O-acetylase OafA/YrhL